MSRVIQNTFLLCVAERSRVLQRVAGGSQCITSVLVYLELVLTLGVLHDIFDTDYILVSTEMPQKLQLTQQQLALQATRHTCIQHKHTHRAPEHMYIHTGTHVGTRSVMMY